MCGCDRFYCDNTIIHDIIGANPQSGIDFESEDSSYPNSDCYMTNCLIYNCKSLGVTISNGIKDIYFTNNNLQSLRYEKSINKIIIRNNRIGTLFAKDTTVNNTVNIIGCEINKFEGVQGTDEITFTNCSFIPFDDDDINISLFESSIIKCNLTFNNCNFITLANNALSGTEKAIFFFYRRPKKLICTNCVFNINNAGGLSL